MPRTTLSVPGFNSLTDHNTDAAWITFLAIGLHYREEGTVKSEFESITRPGETMLYVCDNNVQTIHKDEDTIRRYHYPYPFEVTLADASIDRAQTVQLALDNIDRTLTDILRRAKYPIQVNYSLGMVIKTTFGNVQGENVVIGSAESEGAEIRVLDLELVNVSWDEAVITGTLTKDDIMGRAFPSNHPFYEAMNFPGLFGTRGFDDYEFNNPT